MIGKLLAAVVGAKVAERGGKIDSAGGAILGLAAGALVRRMRVTSMLALVAGAILAKSLEGDRAPSNPTTKS